MVLTCIKSLFYEVFHKLGVLVILGCGVNTWRGIDLGGPELVINFAGLSYVGKSGKIFAEGLDFLVTSLRSRASYVTARTSSRTWLNR